MKNKTEVIKSLSQEQKNELLKHFNSIYECSELTDHEYSIIYLAWMWAKGLIYRDENGMSTFNEEENDVSLNDYEVTFEDDDSGGVNLDLMYTYYGINEIIDKMKWSK